MARIEPQYDSYRSAPMPATSPTLSPTLSAIVAGLRGSSSGIPCSDFADQIRTNVGRLGENTAAHASKQRLAAGAHAEAKHGHRDFDQRHRLPDQGHRPNPVQEAEPKRDVQQSQADHRQTHHGSRTERNLQALIQRVAGPLSRPVAGHRGGTHANPASQTREETTGQKGKRDKLALHLQPECGERAAEPTITTKKPATTMYCCRK